MACLVEEVGFIQNLYSFILLSKWTYVVERRNANLTETIRAMTLYVANVPCLNSRVYSATAAHEDSSTMGRRRCMTATLSAERP